MSQYHNVHIAPPPPPLIFESIKNAPLQIFPPNPTDTNQISLREMLLSVDTPIASIGILDSLNYSNSATLYYPEKICAFVNRLIGRIAFQSSKLNITTPSIYLYYNKEQRCIYLLGTSPSLYTTGSVGDQMKQQKHAMEVLLHSSCSILLIVQSSARFPTTLITKLQRRATTKTQVLAELKKEKGSSTKSIDRKREKGHARSASYNDNCGSVFTPGRCTALTLFVVPAPDSQFLTRDDANTQQQINSSPKSKQRSPPPKARSAIMELCKNLEMNLITILRASSASSSNTIAGIMRQRDVLTFGNLNKDRRLFNIDHSHCVMIVSPQSVTAEATVSNQLERILSIGLLESDVSLESCFKRIAPMQDDGIQHIVQYIHRFIEQVLNIQSTGKLSIAEAYALQLLTLPKWLLAFQTAATITQAIVQNTRKHRNASKDSR